MTLMTLSVMADDADDTISDGRIRQNCIAAWAVSVMTVSAMPVSVPIHTRGSRPTTASVKTASAMTVSAMTVAAMGRSGANQVRC